MEKIVNLLDTIKHTLINEKIKVLSNREELFDIKQRRILKPLYEKSITNFPDNWKTYLELDNEELNEKTILVNYKEYKGEKIEYNYGVIENIFTDFITKDTIKYESLIIQTTINGSIQYYPITTSTYIKYIDENNQTYLTLE